MNLKELINKINTLQEIESKKLDTNKYKRIIVDIEINDEGAFITHERFTNGNNFPTHKLRRPLKMLDYLIKYKGEEKKL